MEYDGLHFNCALCPDVEIRRPISTATDLTGSGLRQLNKATHVIFIKLSINALHAAEHG